MQTYGSNPYTLSDDNTLYPNPSNAEAFFYGSSEIPSKIVFLHDKTGHIISATLHKSRIYILYSLKLYFYKYTFSKLCFAKINCRFYLR